MRREQRALSGLRLTQGKGEHLVPTPLKGVHAQVALESPRGMRFCLQTPLTFPGHPRVRELTVLCSALSIALGTLESQSGGERGGGRGLAVCPSHPSACPASQTAEEDHSPFSTPLSRLLPSASPPPTLPPQKPQTWHPAPLVGSTTGSSALVPVTSHSPNHLVITWFSGSKFPLHR